MVTANKLLWSCLSATARFRSSSSSTTTVSSATNRFSFPILFQDAIFQSSPLRLRPLAHTRSLSISVSDSSTPSRTADFVPPPTKILESRWRPMCLYHTQGKCTMIDDAEHLAKFNHDISKDLRVSGDTVLKNHCASADLDRLLVLDLEGKVEILEFPVFMIDAKTMTFIDSFHRFVRPVRMSERRVNEYIDGKYGKLGIDGVWRDTAIPFKEVIHEFETWLASHNLWNNKVGGALNRAAFVTCGNWDLKTKIPQQCRDSCMKPPPYFSEWINLKDIFINFYKIRARGMRSMMTELGISLLGSHHLGIDDTKNITRVLQRMIADGSPLQITARRRISSGVGSVEFLLENRIR